MENLGVPPLMPTDPAELTALRHNYPDLPLTHTLMAMDRLHTSPSNVAQQQIPFHAVGHNQLHSYDGLNPCRSLINNGTFYARSASSMLPPDNTGAAEGKPTRIPLIMADLGQEADSVSHYAARFPKGLGPYNLPQPLSIRRELPKMDDDTGELFNDFSVEEFPWRLTDGKQREFVGRLDGLDAYTYFICIDKGTHGELIPLDGWYTFTQEVGSRMTSSATLEERKCKAVRPRPLSSILQKKGSGDSDDGIGGVSGKNKTPSTVLLDDGDELGLQRRQRKQLKRIREKRKANMTETKDEQRHGNSALSMGAVKKAKVDWDFDGDAMSDDEEYLANSNGEKDADENLADTHASEFDDSDVEKEELTSYGQKVNQLLASHEEKEADDELAAISDEEDGVESLDEDESSGVNNAARTTSENPYIIPNDENAAVWMSSQQVHPAGYQHQVVLPPHSQYSSMHGSVLSPATECHAVRPHMALQYPQALPINGRQPISPGGAGHSASYPVHKDVASSTTRQSTASTAPAPAHNAPTNLDRLRVELQTAVTRCFHRHGGRMRPKDLFHELNITTKNERFTILKDLINEMCECDNQSSKMLELKEKFRAQ